MKNYFILFLLFCCGQIMAQENTAILKGKIIDEYNKPIEKASIYLDEQNIGVVTSSDGSFNLKVPANIYLKVRVSCLGFKEKNITYRLNKGETKNISISLEINKNTIVEIKKSGNRNRTDAGNVRIDIKPASIMPSTIGGIEGLLKIFLSGNNNELTSQYNVRGGNFDENLVYINDFEVYRPFLVRSGQQEGLSVINSDMVQGVNFSTGGFQAKYGDKMSSILDVQYKKPKTFSSSATVSLLQASFSTEGLSKNKKLTYLFGVRQKSNQYLLGAQQTKGAYNPSFTDVQANIHYDINEKWSCDILGNYARNRFSFIPVSARSNFGLFNNVFALDVQYNGNEIDKFDSRFAGVSFSKNVNEKLTLKYLASGFQTNENETYDILGEYLLGQVESDLGSKNFNQIKYALGTGIIHNFARNYLTMNVTNIGHKGSYDAGKHFVQWGANLNTVQINDKLNEWERRDSAGFSQPASTTQLFLYKSYNTQNIFNYNIISGFIQDNVALDSAQISLTYGARFNYDFLNKELLISPRLQGSWKPKTWKKNAILRGAAGLYQQPPFYREMRNLNGDINANVRAQKSAHIVLGTDYNFKSMGKPFKLTAETYYKQMWDLVPYEYDNVRIRYWGRNDSKGYAMGTEFRLYGDIVKDAESWVSVGIMKTGEDILDDKKYIYNTTYQIIDSVNPGYIPRPTDSRFTLGLFFQDYFPTNKNIKVHLNAMYGSGLPFGPPDNNRYNDVYRLPAYKRVDIGFSALLVDGEKKNKPYYSMFHKFDNIWGSVEVFNLLDIRNTLSYQWIQDLSSGNTYAVPNRLTSRLLNVKLICKF
jgi:CarboxypepD_reg-like domain/TonB-dependent Receptor Plug Domain